MTEIQKIESWNPPIWHKDFGDASIELNILKTLCLFINNLDFNYLFHLDCFEDGYMKVDVFKHEKMYLEIYVVDVKTERVGLFFQNGKEVYIQDIKEVEKYLN